MSAAMTANEMDALLEQRQNSASWQVTQLQQELAIQKFETRCLHFKNQLSRIRHLSSELPHCLASLKGLQPLNNAPEFAIVTCYPFSQECFIYHAVETGLSTQTLRKIQQVLLPLSSGSNDEQNLQHLKIDQHIANLLFTGQDFLVWRIYLDVQDLEQINHSVFMLLDRCIREGFQERDQQHRYMQDILQQERRAFSADLHDSIAQILGYLRLKSAQLYQQCKQPAYQELVEQVEDISNYTHYAYQQVRELITASRLAQELDFIKALKKVIQEFEQQSSIVFELDHRTHHINIQPRHSVQVLYIIRESLSNIVRHSHASYARIYLHVEEQKLQVRISDNGQGINLHRKRKDSFGLDIMQERAERIGAVLKIYPEQPKGTCVELTLNVKGGE